MGTHDDTSVTRWVGRRLETLAPRDDWHPDTAHARERFEAAQAARTSGRRLWSVTLATAALASVALAAIPSTRLLAARCVVACVGQVSRAGQFLRGEPEPSDRVATPGTAAGCSSLGCS